MFAFESWHPYPRTQVSALQFKPKGYKLSSMHLRHSQSPPLSQTPSYKRLNPT